MYVNRLIEIQNSVTKTRETAKCSGGMIWIENSKITWSVINVAWITALKNNHLFTLDR